MLLTTLLVSNLNDAGAGSLRQAITDANAAAGADIINFAAGVTGAITLSQELLITDSVTVNGPGSSALAISGNNAVRVLQIGAGAQVAVSGLTLRNGNAPWGAGVLNAGNLTLDHVVITANAATNTSTAVGNYLYGGGGIQNLGNLQLNSSTVSGNTAGRGGGIQSITPVANAPVIMIIQASTISGNASLSFGGGIDNVALSTTADLTLLNSTVSGNTAGTTAGISVNEAGSRVVLRSSTISGNAATNQFGGIWNGGGGVVDTGNTIIAGNVATPNRDVTGTFLSRGHNVIGIIDGSTGWVANDWEGTAASPVNAKLAPLGDYGGPTQTMIPLPGSPASNNGDNALNASATDQRGFARILGVIIDAGAVEGALPSNLVVDTLSDGIDGDYSAGMFSLREAVLAANTIPGADTISFAGGLSGAITLTLGELLLKESVTITGPGAASLAVSGNDASRVFGIAKGVTATISGLTVRNGNSPSGGGILNNGDLTLNQMVIAANTATDGPPIGGYSQGGGGIQNLGSLQLNYSTVSGNASTARGGGIQNLAAASAPVSMTISHSTISGNTVAGIGAGIDNVGQLASADLMLINSTVSGNSSALWTAGISNNEAGAHLVLRNSTIAGNTAAVDYGGIYNGSGGTVDIGNTIIAGNTGASYPDAAGPFISRGYSLIGKTDGTSGWNASDKTGTIAAPLDPKLGPLANNGGLTQTMALLTGSPAFNAGDNGLIPGDVITDQRGAGFDRIIAQKVDIGAFEKPATESLIVTTTADEDDGTSDPNAGAGTSLREAINYANSHAGDDTITFSPAFAVAPSKTITLSLGELQVTDNGGKTTITGPGANLLSVSGNNSTRVFNIDYATAEISGLKITGGFSTSGSGGGIHNSGTLAIINVTLSGNRSYDGGGVYSSGTLTISGSTIEDNSADSSGGGVHSYGTLTVTNSTLARNKATSGDGGGIYSNGSHTPLTVAGCVFQSNTAYRGAAICNYGSLNVANSAFSGNSASSVGGGISNSGNTATVTNSTLSGNSSGQGGGGIHHSGGTLTVASSTLSANQTYYSGGGIYSYSTLIVINSTLYGNEATEDGGGIYSGGSLKVTNSTLSANKASGSFSGGGGICTSFNTATINNTLVAGNTATTNRDVYGQIESNGANNLIGDGTGMTGLSHGVNGNQVGSLGAPIDPKLGPLADNGGPTKTMELLLGSPALNAGSNSRARDAQNNALTTDQRGQTRIAGGTVDIGSYERQPAPLIITGTSDSDTIFISEDATNLTFALNLQVTSIPRGLITSLSIAGNGGTDGVVFSGDANAATSTVNLAGSFVLLRDAKRSLIAGGTSRVAFAVSQRLPRLVLADSAAGSLLTGGLVLTVGELSMSTTATLDLADGSLVVDPTIPLAAGAVAAGDTPTVLDMLQPLLLSGRNGGAWNGVGINSSVAHRRQYTAVALGPGLSASGATAQYTYNGDANIDGVVDGDDYFQIDQGFLSQKKNWFNGDFNYDGKVSAEDYVLIDSAYLGQRGKLPVSGPEAVNAAVNEPATIGVADSILAQLFSTEPVV